MNVFIVYAHPEPKSFNCAMKDLAVSVFGEQGHAVVVSDLYSMQFKASIGRDDFLELANPDFFKYGLEQINAFQKQLFSPDIVAEQDKLRWANLVIFQFPLYWHSMPAIMKGWVDRVFTLGFAYGGGRRYETGGLKGRKALLAITTGSGPETYSSTGANGDISGIIAHIQHGMLEYVGMEALPPFIAWSPAQVEQRRRIEYLEEYKTRLLAIF